MTADARTTLGPVPAGPGDAFAAGLDALRREHYEAGHALLLAAAQADPGDADIQAYLSGACLSVGRPGEAAEAAERALALAAGRFAPRLKAGELARRLGDLNGARVHLEAALDAARGTGEVRAARAALADLRRLEAHAITHAARLPAWRGRSARARRAPSITVAGGSIE